MPAIHSTSTISVLLEILAVQQPRAKSFRQVVLEIEFQKPRGDKDVVGIA
jgi:hypothetical protein